jgi:hypothetical protein
LIADGIERARRNTVEHFADAIIEEVVGAIGLDTERKVDPSENRGEPVA